MSSWRSRVGLLAALAVVAAVPAAWASNLFADVPSTHPFHDATSAVGLAGITTGCSTPPRRYCPDDYVTRGQMAAFMHRGFGRVTRVSPGATDIPASAAVPIWSADIEPGLPEGALSGAAAFVKADAAVRILQVDATGCPCHYAAVLELDGVPMNWGAEATLTSPQERVTLPLTGVAAVTDAGPATVELYVWRFYGGSGLVYASANGDLTAAYFPFGGSGTNALTVRGGAAASRAGQP